MPARATVEYTEVIVCGHCGNKAPMKVIGRCVVPTTFSRDSEKVVLDVTYEMCSCLACENNEFHLLGNNSRFVLLPQPTEIPQSLPDSVARAYEEARAVKHKSANAYAVLLGRLLEAICDDRNTKGDDLYKRLKDLADRGEIPAQLGQLAQRLRELRNVGAHAKQGELTAAHVPILDNITRALLDYLYAVPGYLEEAEKQLDELRNRRTT